MINSTRIPTKKAMPIFVVAKPMPAMSMATNRSFLSVMSFIRRASSIPAKRSKIPRTELGMADKREMPIFPKKSAKIKNRTPIMMFDPPVLAPNL